MLLRGRGREGVLSRLCRRAAGATVTSSPLPQVVRLPWRSGTPHTRNPGGQGVFADDLVHREERGRKTGPVCAHCTQQTKAGLKRRLLGESEKAIRRRPERPTGRNRLFRLHWQNQSPFHILLVQRGTVVRYLGTSGRNTITRWEVCVRGGYWPPSSRHPPPPPRTTLPRRPLAWNRF
jgi:hypothetical protein